MPKTSSSPISLPKRAYIHKYCSGRVLQDMLAPHRKPKVPPKGPAVAPQTPRNSGEGGAGPGGDGEGESGPPLVVLPSSTDLFLFYAQSLEQCAKLSTGQA